MIEARSCDVLAQTVILIVAVVVPHGDFQRRALIVIHVHVKLLEPARVQRLWLDLNRSTKTLALDSLQFAAV